jgi:hypothetical protein
MTLTFKVTPKELERAAGVLTEGRSFKIMLANASATTLSISSTRAQWEAAELSGSGYAAVTGTVPDGAWNAIAGRYDTGVITATFTASGGTLLYDTVVVLLGSDTYPHSIGTEAPALSLLSGQSKTYPIILAEDD